MSKILKMFHLTPVQAGMLFHSLMNPAECQYYEQVGFILHGQIRLELLEEAWKQLIKRHEILRTDIIWKQIKVPVQVILQEKESQVVTTDISQLSSSEQEEYLAMLRERELKKIDLEQNRMNYVSFLRCSEETYYMCWTFHHILLDGWSISVLIRDLLQIYHSLATGELLPPEPVAQFSKYLEWLKNRQTIVGLRFWEQNVCDLTEPTYLPGKINPGGKFRVANLVREFTVDESRQIHEYCRAMNVTLNALIQTGWGILLQKYNNSLVSCSGMAVSGRPVEIKKVEEIAGILINTIPVVIKTLETDRVKDLLTKVHTQLIEMQEYSYLPLPEIQKRSAVPLEQKFFDTLVAVENHPSSGISLHNQEFSLEFDQGFEVTNYDFTMQAKGGEQIRLAVAYNQHGYFEKEISRILNHFTHLIMEIVQRPDEQVINLSLLPEPELQRQFAELNQTEWEYDKTKTVQELIEEVVSKYPESDALVFQGKRLSYRELNQRANQLAWKLSELGVGPDQLVAVMAERSFEMVIALVGILKAGGAYLPIDPTYPKERIDFILADSAPTLILAQSWLQELSRDSEIPSYSLDDPLLYSERIDNLSVINQATDLAYVIYTSGSTGTPKGVMLEHRGIGNLQEFYIQTLGVGCSERILQFASCSFDASIFEIFMALLTGSALYLVSREVIDQYTKFTEFVNENQISTVTLPPIYLTNLNPEAFLSLQKVITAGSASSYELVNQWKDHVCYYNAYGPTETTICATIWQYSKDEVIDEVIPIGKPLYNTRVYILDPYMQPVPDGLVGELCITGDGIARGYLRRDELTQERFILNPWNLEERLYRTGDLVTRSENGNLLFVGRIDDQVKIRGYRIEPGEIEYHLKKHPDVREVAVTAKKDSTGELSLWAFVISDVESTKLREFLQQRVPEYMLPAHYIYLQEMPLTANQKIDYRALRDLALEERGGYIAPMNELESRLAEIWSETLKVSQLGVLDHFFDLGGHSLNAIQISTRIARELEVDISVAQIFQNPTIRQLAVYLKSRISHSFTPIQPIAEQDYYPVSSAQRRLYAVREITGDSITYNIPLIWKVEGDLELSRLEEVFTELIERHQILRTSFMVHAGQVVQKVHHEGVLESQFSIQVIDTDKELLDQTIASFVQPFDLGVAPLFRVGVIRCADEELLIIDIHHIIADGVALDILFRELVQLYEGQKLPMPEIQFKDYAVWQNQSFDSLEMQKQETYWVERFADEIPQLRLATDFARPAVMTFAGDSQLFDLPKELSEKMHQLAGSNGVTLQMLLLAIVQLWLAKYSGQTDLVVGIPTTGRSHPDLAQMLGMFVNNLPLRCDIPDDKSFLEFLQIVKLNSLQAYENQDYPFESLVDRLELGRDLSRNPLFDVMFILQNAVSLKIKTDGIVFRPFYFNFKRAKFDLTLHVFDEPAGLKFDLVYNTSLFTSKTVGRMAKHLEKLCAEIVLHPEALIKDFALITSEERELILQQFNNTLIPYPREKTIVQLFEEQVECTPNEPAVIRGAELITYHELNCKANSLAWRLRQMGAGPNQRIGIMSEPSIEMIIGVVAIIKSGAAYLPIDVDYPASRIEFMLQDGDVEILLTHAELVEEINYAGKVIDLCSDQLSHELHNPPQLNQPDDLIYIMYTSGSTGTPKGVMIQHMNVNRLVSQSNMLVISPEERILQTGSLAFDASTFEIWGALLNGARLYLLEKGDLLASDLLKKKMWDYQITMAWFTSALFNQLWEENSAIFVNLQTLIIGGDALSPKHVNGLRERYPEIEVINGYGPTEGTTFTTYYPIKETHLGSIPIGRPVSNTRVYVLSRDGHLQPPGVPGELCIAGDGLAKGYLNQAELTAEKFCQNPVVCGERIYHTGDLVRWREDGLLEFIGRIDHQVKIRGFRIELAEIEYHLAQYPGVIEVVVIVRESEQGKYLSAYLVAEGELNLSELKKYLSFRLPEYMIPAYFVQVDKLPLTANGKVNRHALLTLDENMLTGEKYTAPETEVEERLVKIWTKLLGTKKIGIYDSFFDLGGNSIKLITLANLINQEFELQIRTVELFNLTTIAQLGEYITTSLQTEESEEIEEAMIEYSL